MNKIVLQDGIFNFESDIKLKDYQDHLNQLSLINEIFIKTGMEFDFIRSYLEKMLKQKRELAGNPEIELSAKEVKKYSRYASEALRCNILSNITSYPCRVLSNMIAGSSDYQTFIFAGDLSRSSVPGKSRINDFAKIIRPEELKEMLSGAMLKLKEDKTREALGLQHKIETDIIWADCTCLLTNIHFPVDWILLRDAVRSTIRTIETIRKHGIVHRMKKPSFFISEINSLCMKMSNTRRKANSKKARKSILREMKQLADTVLKHAERYRKLLQNSYKEKTDLTEKQMHQFADRLTNIIDQIPAAKKQAHKRIITEEKVPAKGKILSLYDDNVNVVPRGKAGAEVEFGNELLIAEQQDGFILGWEFYENKTSDTKKLPDILENFSIDRYKVGTLVTDRGFYSISNSKSLEDKNIFNCILPKSISEMQKAMKNKNYRALQKRRSQTETRIAITKNFTGKKLKSKDFEYKAMKVGWAIITHNLVLLSRIIKEERKDLKAAA